MIRREFRNIKLGPKDEKLATVPIADVPVFHITSQQETDLSNCFPQDGNVQFNHAYLVPPFGRFGIQVDSYDLYDDKGTDPVTVAPFYLVDATHPTFVIGVKLRARQNEFTDNDETSYHAIFDPVSGIATAEVGDAGEVVTAAWNSDQPVRLVAAFMLLLNQRSVRCTYFTTESRQVRRWKERRGMASQRDISIYIPREIVRHVSNASCGKGVRTVAPHAVRGHVRRLPGGATTRVRPHHSPRRGDVNRKARIPIYDARSLDVDQKNAS